MKFTVYGTPVAKGRPKFAVRGGFAKAYTPEKTVNYENLVKLFYKQSGGGMMNGELSVSIRFFFPIPKSATKKHRARMESGSVGHTKRPDIDNCVKSVFDALNGVAWEDDSSVTLLMAYKRYSSEPRTEVSIESMEVLYDENGDTEKNS